MKLEVVDGGKNLREPKQHVDIKANSDRVLSLEENSNVDVSKFQCDKIGKEEVDEVIKSEEVVNNENNIVKMKYVDFLGIGTYWEQPPH